MIVIYLLFLIQKMNPRKIARPRKGYPREKISTSTVHILIQIENNKNIYKNMLHSKHDLDIPITFDNSGNEFESGIINIIFDILYICIIYIL